MLYHSSSCFGARITVSTKEFFWNPSLNAILTFFRDFGPLTPTKNGKIRHVGVGGEDVIQVWWEKSNSLHSPMVIKRLVYLVFLMQLSGESKEKKNQVRFNTQQNSKKTNGECITISESLLSGWWESSVLKWSSFWCLSLKMLGSLHPFADCSILPLLEQAFQWVQKNFCRTSPSMQNYDFKEFLTFKPD